MFAPAFLPGSAFLTSFQLSLAGSFLKLSGSSPAAAHRPSSLADFSQTPSFSR